MNRIILKGRLTRDPELSVTNSGIEYLGFSIAVPRPYNRDEVDFINCTAWRKTAVFVTEHFVRGKEILLEGSLRQETWEDKDGNKRSTFNVQVDNVEFCGAKQDTEQRSTAPAQSTAEQSSPTEDLPW